MKISHKIASPTFLRLFPVLFASLLLWASAGCTMLEKCGCIQPKDPEPVGHIDMFFHQEVRLFDDTEKPGTKVPGLVGRIWVYPESATYPSAVPGTIKAAVYDVTNVANGGEPVLLHPYLFAPNVVRTLKGEDKLGVGYSVYLPMESYHPGVKQVQVRLWFEADKNQCVAAIPQVLNLRAEQEPPKVEITTRSVVPGLDPSFKR